MTDKAPEPLDLIAQLNGRIAFCRNRGEVKTPTLLTQAADAIEAAQARIATARAEALEEAARVLDLHESVPCKPAFPDAWSDEAKDAYENGQLDAAISWQSAIRALKEKPNG